MQSIRAILIVVLSLNWLVAILKILFGYKIKSASMVSDGYHSFSDGASNIIGLIGVSVAMRPKDANHPYGHKKYETFTAIIIAVVLFILSFHILHDTLERFHKLIIPQVSGASFFVMILTMMINSVVMLCEYKAGKKFASDILVADSLHTRSDILTSGAVIVSLVGVKAGYPVCDPVCSLGIALCIAYSGFGILRSSSRVLCDMAIVDVKKIEAIAKGIEGVAGCHEVRTRGRVDDIHIDLHVLVKKDMPVEQADILSDTIEEAIKAKIGGVSDVVVHIEPKK